MKKFTIFILALFALCISAINTQAHFLVSDKNIGVLVHIDPDDEPIIGQTAHIHLNYESHSGVLTNTNCSCLVEILKAGEVLSRVSTETLDGSEHTYMIDYVFPEKGIYTLHLFGDVKGSQPIHFDMNYDLRVEREGSATSHIQTNTLSPLLLGVITVVVCLCGMVICTRLIKKS